MTHAHRSFIRSLIMVSFFFLGDGGVWDDQEEDLDCQQGVIDFSLYLRSSHHYYQTSDSILDPDNMTTVLDQKNYIEELNRHLK